MNILLLMDAYIRVPPLHYGGIERVVADLADGLVLRGHNVTLWAAPGSRTDAALESFGREGEWTGWSNVRNTLTLGGRFARMGRRFDVIHNFGRLAYLLSIARHRVGKVQTYMRPVNPANMKLFGRVGARELVFTAVSDAIRRTGAPGGGDWRVIYNCARPALYTLSTNVDAARAPLLFLGRLERCKGAHTAIDVARAANRKLIIAGNVSTVPHEKDYFERELKPRFDGELISYIGPVNDQQKIKLLGESAALMMPIEWEEPFPVTLPEAMLCGTPLIAFRRGGVPEGIIDGVTGFVCDTPDQMRDSIARLPEIDRRACRADAERRFSDEVITSAYESLYEELVSAGG
ncbi:MAG TPA: glycosyltransferase [Vicinamibacterales bacterium]|nr:glycosyltransferase [Vicinamibacterales bacterium]